MAKHYMADPIITINGVDLSDHVRTVTVTMTQADLPTTAMGATAVERIAGLRDDSFEVEFYQDFAAAEVHATLNPLFVAKTQFVMSVRATAAAISATNPSFEGTVILTNIQPLNGAVGDVNMTSVTFPSNGAIVVDIVP